jgi:cation diffusion facilitator CzcD-associated flavoprotein CzcO
MAITVDKEALRRKYREERDKRLRPDGNDQYIHISDLFSPYGEDPFTPVVERESRHDHVTVAVVGAGFAGLLTAARLKENGIGGVRLIDSAGDVGGTWYWNRYPGVQCDTASMVYMPLLEETGHMPSEKYAHGPEILTHCRRIANHYDLYQDAFFHTKLTDLSWDGSRAVWVLRTDRGDEFTAQFVSLGLGPLNVPKLPGIPGIDRFAGHSFHTSRWDYDYTGVNPDGAPLSRLADKRLGIIGTGATAVQVIPHLAEWSKHLYVFQRTPSSVDARFNAPMDPAWFASIATPGWQERWLKNFADNQAGGFAEEDLVMDGWTDIARRIKARIIADPPSEWTAEAIWTIYEEADLDKMEEIRARVGSIVSDPAVAERLKAWYRQLCKRPCFHDEYLHSFNRPNVSLVDTDGKGVERITEKGAVVAEIEYELDCIIYASGFETSFDVEWRTGFAVTGREGVHLADYWARGMRTMHGTHVHGFPNLFLVQPFQGANLISNVPHNLYESARTISLIVKHTRDHGYHQVEVSGEAEDAWTELLLSGPGMVIASPDCTPGYYNNEGRYDDPRIKHMVGYPLGPSAYFDYIDGWRSSGSFEGLSFS